MNAGATNFISNGGRNSTADIVMDGVSQTNQENNSGITTALYTPPVDAVEEFKVQQNTYSADIGFGGNTVIWRPHSERQAVFLHGLSGDDREEHRHSQSRRPQSF